MPPDRCRTIVFAPRRVSRGLRPAATASGRRPRLGTTVDGAAQRGDGVGGRAPGSIRRCRDRWFRVAPAGCRLVRDAILWQFGGPLLAAAFVLSLPRCLAPVTHVAPFPGRVPPNAPRVLDSEPETCGRGRGHDGPRRRVRDDRGPLEAPDANGRGRMWFASPGPGRRRMQPIRATTPWAAAHPRLIAAAPGGSALNPWAPTCARAVAWWTATGSGFRFSFVYLVRCGRCGSASAHGIEPRTQPPVRGHYGGARPCHSRGLRGCAFPHDGRPSTCASARRPPGAAPGSSCACASPPS